MAHYILPIVPALAILVGATFSQAHPVSTKIMRPEAFAGCAYLCLAAALVVALVWPQILPRSLEIYANSGWRHPSLAAIAGIFATLSLLAVMRPRVWRNASGLYAATMAGFALVVQLSPAVTAQVAEHRSSRLLAEATSAHIHPEDQLVLYGGYPSSLPFYLELQRPIWVVWSENKRQVLGSDYVALQRPAPAPGYGRVLYGEEEISQLWRNSNQRMIAFVPNKALDRFAALAGAAAHILLRNDDMVLIANRLSGRQTPAMPPDGNHERVAMRNSHGNLDNHDGIVNLDR